MTYRTITGCCVSKTKDAHGQIHEVERLTWNTPLPLRREHGSFDVGRVVRIWRDGDRIMFNAEVEDDNIWSAIENGTSRDVSISLRNPKSDDIDDNGTRRVYGGEIAEVSVCEAGANPDATFEISGMPPLLPAVATNLPVESPMPTANDNAPAQRKARGWEIKEGLVEPVYPAGARQRGDQATLNACLDALIEYQRAGFSALFTEQGIEPGHYVPFAFYVDLAATVKALSGWHGWRAKELEDRVHELEANQQKFCGPHNRAQGYSKGNMVVHGGGLWMAIMPADVGAIPGQDPAWMLACKKGTFDE